MAAAAFPTFRAFEVVARARLGVAVRLLSTSSVGEDTHLGGGRASSYDERGKGRKGRKRYQGREFLKESDNVQPWKDISHAYNCRIQEMYKSCNVGGEDGGRRCAHFCSQDVGSSPPRRLRPPSLKPHLSSCRRSFAGFCYEHPQGLHLCELVNFVQVSRQAQALNAFRAGRIRQEPAPPQAAQGL